MKLATPVIVATLCALAGAVPHFNKAHARDVIYDALNTTNRNLNMVGLTMTTTAPPEPLLEFNFNLTSGMFTPSAKCSGQAPEIANAPTGWTKCIPDRNNSAVSFRWDLHLDRHISMLLETNFTIAAASDFSSYVWQQAKYNISPNETNNDGVYTGPPSVSADLGLVKVCFGDWNDGATGICKGA
ncbi:hypothetical protein B0T17DRAFT_630068 [Bombardia bombarda]|uniref:Uncharacterized protein n=1 Tax=Bombardia bombarda TaxID=252184 RepID=A0AA39W3Z9_9PEZI|nr:hypothetical protein B0T17DRAFT_630068 [Bombardia bombarda]